MSSYVHNIWIIKNKIWCEYRGDRSQSIGNMLEFHVLSGTKLLGTYLAQQVKQEVFFSRLIRPLARKDNSETHKEEFKWRAKSMM